MDAHINNLSRMCRVCTSRVQTYKEIQSKKIKVLAKDHMDHIYILYGIDISQDKIAIHGQYLCYPCHRRIINSLKTGYKGPNEDELNLEGIYAEQRSMMEGKNIWCEHSDNCAICDLYNEQCKPGRVKTSTKGRPKQHTSTEEISFNEHQFCKFQDLSIIDSMSDSIVSVEEDQDHCICPICKDVLHKQAVNTGCHHFCALCLSRYYNTEKKHKLPCPVCYNAIDVNDVKPISDQFLMIINKARVKCKNCGISGRVNGMRCHICTSTPTKSSDQEPGTSAETEITRFEPEQHEAGIEVKTEDMDDTATYIPTSADEHTGANPFRSDSFGTEQHGTGIEMKMETIDDPATCIPATCIPATCIPATCIPATCIPATTYQHQHPSQEESTSAHLSILIKQEVEVKKEEDVNAFSSVPINQETEVKREEDVNAFSSVPINQETEVKREEDVIVFSSVPKNQLAEVKKEQDVDAFSEITVNQGSTLTCDPMLTESPVSTDCTMTQTIKEEEHLVISLYTSIGQIGQQGWNCDNQNLIEMNDCKDENDSMITDNKSDLPPTQRWNFDNQNLGETNEECNDVIDSMIADSKSDLPATQEANSSGVSFTDDSDMCFIVKAETGEVCEVIDMSKDSSSQSASMKKGENPYKCDKCEYSTKRKSEFVRHERTHSGEKPFKCGECDLAFTLKSTLKRHKLTHTGIKSFNCDKCDYSTFHGSQLKRHKLKHAGIKPFSCDKCDYSCYHKKDIKAHKLIHSGEKPFKCDECDYSCIQSSHLKVHKQIHSDDRDKPFKCDECDFCATQKSHLKRHQLIHTGIKAFRCDECDYSCNQINNLKVHKQIHADDKGKPFKCDECDNSFARKSGLTQHMVNNSKEIPFKCDECDFSCNSKCNLKQHKQIHSGKHPFKCDECDYSSKVKNHLKRHKVIHSASEDRKKPFKCDECDYSSVFKSAVKRHKVNRHT